MDSIVKKEFSNRFKTLLDEKNETIYNLSELLHLNPSTISRYKNGLMSPKLIIIEKIAEYFNVNPVWLMGYDVERDANIKNKKENSSAKTSKRCKNKNVFEKDISKIIELYSKLPKDMQEKALKNVSSISKK